jgi:perosamine synthetase
VIPRPKPDIACYSYHPTKLVTTGEGGMMATKHFGFHTRAKRFRDHGRFGAEVAELGINGRLSDIHCALGISQLERAGQSLVRRQEIAARYDETFSSLARVTPLKQMRPNARHLYVVKVEDRDCLRKHLAEAGIDTQVHYRSLTLEPLFAGQSCPVAEEESAKVVSLPCYPALTKKEHELVIKAVTEWGDQ